MSKDEPLFELDIEKLEKDIERVQKGLEKAEEIAIQAAIDEMVNIVYDLLGEGMRRAPVDEGTLRGSGLAIVNEDQVAHTEKVSEGTAQLIKDYQAGNVSLQRLMNELIGEVVFNTPYATYQHEELGLNHPKGGEAKYLENPLKENAQMYIEGLAEAIEDALDKEGRRI